MSEFLGRAKERPILRSWLDYVDKEQKPLVGVIVADSGLGKTRLVQDFYEQLAGSGSDWNPNNYWPPTFGEDGNPELQDGYTQQANLGPPKFMWLGARFSEKENTTAYSLRPLLMHRASFHHKFIEILQNPTEWKKFKNTLRQKKKEFFEGAIENQIINLIDLAAGSAVAQAVELVLKPLFDAGTSHFKDKKVRNSSTTGLDPWKEEAEKGALEKLVKILEDLKKPNKKEKLPIILFLDDAQWIDDDSLKVVEKLLDEAKKKKITIMVIATHWERDWRNYCREKRKIARLFNSDTEVVKEFLQDSDYDVKDGDKKDKSVEFQGDEKAIQNNILKLGRMQQATLRELIQKSWPGLLSEQESELLDKVNGNVQSLTEIISFVGRSKHHFEDEDDQKPLTQPGMAKIRNMATKRDGIADGIFNNELQEGEQILLGFGAAIGGGRFREPVVVSAVEYIMSQKAKLFDTVAWSNPVDGLKELNKFGILVKAKGVPVWEFHNPIFYSKAHEYYNRTWASEFPDLLKSTNQRDIVDRINTCFDETGELVRLTSGDISPKDGAEEALLAIGANERRAFLENASAQLDGVLSERPEEPSSFRVCCLLFREYARETLVTQAMGEGKKLGQKYDWKNDYAQKLGVEFRSELCDYLQGMGLYRIAVMIAESLKVHFERKGKDRANEEKQATWKLRIAEILIEAHGEDEQYTSLSTLKTAYKESDEAFNIFNLLSNDKKSGPEWYRNTANSRFFCAQASYKMEGKSHIKYLNGAIGNMDRLCEPPLNKFEHRLERVRFRARVRDFFCDQDDWGYAKGEAEKCKAYVGQLYEESKQGEHEGRHHEVLEEYAKCLEELGGIYRQRGDSEAAEAYAQCMEVRLELAKSVLEDYKNKRSEVEPLRHFRNYVEFTLDLGENYEGGNEHKAADEIFVDCLKNLETYYKDLSTKAQRCEDEAQRYEDLGIEAQRYAAGAFWRVGLIQYERAMTKVGNRDNDRRDPWVPLNWLRESEKEAKGQLEQVGEYVDRGPGAGDGLPNAKSARNLGISAINVALEDIAFAKGEMKKAKEQFYKCKRILKDLKNPLELPEICRDEAQTIVHSVALRYSLCLLCGPPSGDENGKTPSDKAASDMIEMLQRVFSICMQFSRYEGFDSEREALEGRAVRLQEKIQEWNSENDDVRGAGGLHAKFKKLEDEFSKYAEKLDRFGSPSQAETEKAGGFRERIAAMRLRQVIGAAVPLVLVLFILVFLTFVTIVNLKVHTARPVLVSWESIEGGTGRLFGRTWLWTDTARVRASAPGHRSAEVVLSKDGTGGFELVLEPLPGVAEINIVGEGPITLSVDGAARQAQPSMRIELAHGPHKALLAGPNIVPTEIDFEMQGFGNVQQFQWSALSANSFLDVQVHPRTAEVLLDGQPWAVGTRNAGVSLGRHTLSAKIPGWYSKAEEFEAVADNTASFRWTLRPKPAVLALSTEPSGVAVLLNGDYVGQSPVSLDLPANRRHVISARQSGRDPVELALSPAPGERMKRTLRLEARTAKAAFSASGPATVRVNGVHAGTLPLAVELRKGDRVEAVADGLAAAPYVVTKLEDVTGSHRFQLMPPAQLAHRSAPELEEVLPGLKLKRIPWSAMGATVSRPFRIAVQEVTYAAYSELLSKRPPSGLTVRHPIVNISWAQAAQFANALSTKRGLPPVYVFDRFGNLLSVNQQSLGFRLPTEAEWLAAAGPGWAHPKGVVRPNWAGSERRSGPRMADHTDRHVELAPAQQAVVGAFDLRGMAGNAAEWLHDYYAPWPSSPPRGYAGPTLGIDHAVRGGSYLTAEKPEVRGFSANPRPDLGFRVAQWLH